MDLEQLYRLIRKYEGLRLKPYLCPAGIPTIGYGSTYYLDGRKVSLSDPAISAEDAEILMVKQANNFASRALILSPSLGKSSIKLSVIADFCYNLGFARYKSSTLKRRIDACDWQGASLELPKWVWGDGKKQPGLILRRKEEVNLLIS